MVKVEHGTTGLWATTNAINCKDSDQTITSCKTADVEANRRGPFRVIHVGFATSVTCQVIG